MQCAKPKIAMVAMCCSIGIECLAASPQGVNTTGKSVTYTCPAEYPTASLRFVDPPPGWTPMVQDRLTLNGAGITEGPMENRGMLAPVHKSYRNHKEDIFTHLSGKTMKEKYLWCGYGGWNDILLYKPLPENTSRCVVTYLRTPGINAYQVKDIVCN